MIANQTSESSSSSLLVWNGGVSEEEAVRRALEVSTMAKPTTKQDSPISCVEAKIEAPEDGDEESTNHSADDATKKLALAQPSRPEPFSESNATPELPSPGAVHVPGIEDDTNPDQTENVIPTIEVDIVLPQAAVV